MNLNDELRTHIDRIAPPITVGEAVTRGVPEPGSASGYPVRRRAGAARWLVVAAAVAVAAAGALLLVPRGGRDGIQQPVSADGTGLAPLSAGVGRWQERLPDEAFPPFTADGSPSARPTYVTAVTAVPGGYVAVGSAQVVVGRTAETEGELAAEVTGQRAAAWTSPDGRTWTQVVFGRTADPAGVDATDLSPEQAAAGFTRMDAVATRGDTRVAVGNAMPPVGSGPRAWRWQGDGGEAAVAPLPVDGGGSWVTMAGVVATSRAFVAAGTDIGSDVNRGGAVVWTSTDDGATWTQAAAFGPGVVLTSLTAVGDRLVAVGSVDGERPSAAAWTSDDDGATWTPAELPASSLGKGGDGRTEMLRVAASGDGRLLAVSVRGEVTPAGSRTDDAHQIGLATEISLWASGDGGSTWTEQRTLSVPTTAIWRSTLTWGPAGFLLVLSGSEPRYSWLTADGTTVADAGYAGDRWVRAAFATGDAYVAVTDRDRADGRFPVTVAVLPVTP